MRTRSQALKTRGNGNSSSSSLSRRRASISPKKKAGVKAKSPGISKKEKTETRRRKKESNSASEDFEKSRRSIVSKDEKNQTDTVPLEKKTKGRKTKKSPAKCHSTIKIETSKKDSKTNSGSKSVKKSKSPKKLSTKVNSKNSGKEVLIRPKNVVASETPKNDLEKSGKVTPRRLQKVVSEFPKKGSKTSSKIDSSIIKKVTSKTFKKTSKKLDSDEILNMLSDEDNEAPSSPRKSTSKDSRKKSKSQPAKVLPKSVPSSLQATLSQSRRFSSNRKSTDKSNLQLTKEDTDASQKHDAQSSKKPIYANAVKCWNDDPLARDVYMLEEDDKHESYRPVKNTKKRRRRPPKIEKFTQLKSLKSGIGRIPMREKPLLVNSQVNKAKSNDKTIRESFVESAPPSVRVNEDILDEFNQMPSPIVEVEYPMVNIQSTSTNILSINESVRLSTFRKGTFSSSTPTRYDINSSTLPSSAPKVSSRQISTPKPTSIKEQIRNCFGFDESEDEQNDNEIVSPGKSPFVESRFLMPCRLDPSSFKFPKPLSRPGIHANLKRSKKIKKPNCNSSLLFEDPDEIEELKKNPPKQKLKQTIIKPVVQESKVESEEEESGDENVNSCVKKRKRSTSSSVCPSSPKRSKKEEEELHEWENNKSLEFSKIDDFDLTFS